MSSLKLFLFDLDGTLVSTGGAGLRSLSAAFKQIHGVENAHHKINASGKTDPAIFRELIRSFLDRDAEPGEIETIGNCYLGHLEREMKTSNPKIMAGVEAFIDKISNRRDIVIGLGTGNLEKGARLKLGPSNLNRHFEFGGFGSDHEERSEVLRFGHRRAETRSNGKIAPKDVYVIGDTLLDISAAKRAGFKSVAVATGKSTRDELGAGKPDFLLATLLEGNLLL